MARATERHICTNLWAFLHWLRATGRAQLAGRDDLRRWAQAEPDRWTASIRTFAGLPDAPRPLLCQLNPKSTLVLRSDHPPPRRSWSADALADGDAVGLPPALASVLAAVRTAEALTQAVAFVLLDADLRPDDRVLVAGAALWPWACALREGAALIVSPAGSAASLLRIVEEEAATVLVAPGTTLRCFPPTQRKLAAGRRPGLWRNDRL